MASVFVVPTFLPLMLTVNVIDLSSVLILVLSVPVIVALSVYCVFAILLIVRG